MKTQETLDVEYFLIKGVAKKGTYGCKEVTLRHTAYDNYDNAIERVDYATINNYSVLINIELDQDNGKIEVQKEDEFSNGMQYFRTFKLKEIIDDNNQNE